MRNLVLIIILSVLFSSCDKMIGIDSQQKARGESGEIVLVLDSSRWAENIGQELRITFRETVEGLPRDEPMFDLIHIVPLAFKGILRNAKNVVLVVSLNDKNTENSRITNLFTTKSIDSLRANEDIFFIRRKNLFAKGQELVFLINRNDQDFADKISENKEIIRSFFNKVEEERALKELYKTPKERLISNKILEDYKFELRVPYAYKIATSSDNFIWLRQPGQKIDNNIFVAFKDYTDTLDFRDDKIIEWRNQICESYLYGDPENPNSYMVTESIIPPIITEINFKGNYSKKLIGLWKTNNISMGGPFVSYVLVDESLNRMYYFEGFLYSPGVDQRELIRELNIILRTFKTQGQISS
jgi:hypothetical protein